MRNLINFVLFQAAWFACVMGAGAGRPEIGVAATLVICAIHLGAVARDRAGEIRLLIALTIAGSALSAFNVWNGAVTFSPGLFELAGVPLWLMSLWALFATLLRHSLRWMDGRWALAAACGLIGSPLSYSGAERLGAVEIHADFLRGPVVLGVTWAVAVPAALWLARRTRSVVGDNPVAE